MAWVEMGKDMSEEQYAKFMEYLNNRYNFQFVESRFPDACDHVRFLQFCKDLYNHANLGGKVGYHVYKDNYEQQG